MGVRVLIVANEPVSEKIKYLTSLFSVPVIVKTRPTLPSNLNLQGVKLGKESILDMYTFLLLLREIPPGDDVVFLHDTMTTMMEPERIQLILNTLSNRGSFDLCYLGKWQDRCDLHEYSFTSERIDFVNTYMPHGTHALYISSRGRAKLLTPGFLPLYEHSLSQSLMELIKDHRLVALTSVPNIFQYDYKNIKDPKDYLRTQECRLLPDLDPLPLPTAREGLSLWWFLLIVLVVLILAYWVTVSKTPVPA